MFDIGPGIRRHHCLATIEFEPGAVPDRREALERIPPMSGHYHHNEAWGDGNSYARLRACVIRPLLPVPIEDGQLRLGTWPQAIRCRFR